MEGKWGLGGLANLEKSVGREYTWGLRENGERRRSERKKKQEEKERKKPTIAGLQSSLEKMFLSSFLASGCSSFRLAYALGSVIA